MDLSYRELYLMDAQKTRLKMMRLLSQGKSIAEVSRLLHTSRNLVRKWRDRFAREGISGLANQSRRPKRSPNKTAAAIEKRVLGMRKVTGFGRERLSFYLARDEGLKIAPDTIRHILRRAGYRGRKRPRKVFYPAQWAWATKQPFSLAQVDTKDVLDKGTLGTKRWHHILEYDLPRYQWTFCEARSRFRLLAASEQLTLTNGLAFMKLVMAWLHCWGIKEIVQWQADWGDEFGGVNPNKLGTLDSQHYQPFGARLARIPKGRKGYNGRVERSHLTDDYEFYIPCILKIMSKGGWLKKLQAWQYVYNVKRNHFGYDMNRKTPLEKLIELGYNIDERFAMFPVVLLDKISSNFITTPGNDVLTKDKSGRF